MNKITIRMIVAFGVFFFVNTPCNQLKAKGFDSAARTDIQHMQGQLNNLESRLTAQQTDSLTRKEIRELQIGLENTKNLSQIANTTITWTGIILGGFSLVFTLVSIVVGLYARSKYIKIRSTKVKLEKMHSDYENKLKEAIQSNDNLYSAFEKEKDLLLKLIFPVIKGENSYLQGDYFNVFYHYDEAKKIAPNHPWLKTFVWPLINSGRFDEAIRYLNSQLESDPNNNDWKYYLAHVYRRQGRLDDSEKLIEPVATEEKHALALYEYATILFIREDFNKAEKMYKKANERHLLPDLYTYLNLAITQTIISKQKDAKGNALEAIKLIKEEQAKTPTNPHLFLQLGVAKMIIEDATCLKDIKKSIEKRNLQSENAKSALDKINKMHKAVQIPEMLEAIKILEKYCNEA